MKVIFKYPIKPQKLLFDLDALEPYISSATMRVQYEKHYFSYIAKLNSLIEGSKYRDASIEEIIIKSSANIHNEQDSKIFNNAGQVFNHGFFWRSMTSQFDQGPSAATAKIISSTFGSVDKMKEKFHSSALELFGSGWVWLVRNKQMVFEIWTSKNADGPLAHGLVPILVCDLWEHAYYLDYKNERGLYLQKFWHLVNWQHIEKCVDESNHSGKDISI